MKKTRNLGRVVMELLGNVEGKDCLIIDDIYDSGATIRAAALCLKKNKAKRIAGYVTHFLNSKAPPIPLYITDTVPLRCSSEKNLSILPILPVIAKFL